MPSGDWMLKILALCPDEETRNNFLDIAEVGSKIPTISRREAPKEGEEAPRSEVTRPDGKRIPKYSKSRPQR